MKYVPEKGESWTAGLVLQQFALQAFPRGKAPDVEIDDIAIALSLDITPGALRDFFHDKAELDVRVINKLLDLLKLEQHQRIYVAGLINEQYGLEVPHDWLEPMQANTSHELLHRKFVESVFTTVTALAEKAGLDTLTLNGYFSGQTLDKDQVSDIASQLTLTRAELVRFNQLRQQEGEPMIYLPAKAMAENFQDRVGGGGTRAGNIGRA